MSEKCPGCGAASDPGRDRRDGKLEIVYKAQEWACGSYSYGPGGRLFSTSKDCLRAQLAQRDAELEELRAVVEKLLEYDHHWTQAGFDEADGASDPAYYDDAEDEDRLAKKRLQEAVHLAKQAAEAAKETDRER